MALCARRRDGVGAQKDSAATNIREGGLLMTVALAGNDKEQKGYDGEIDWKISSGIK